MKHLKLIISIFIGLFLILFCIKIIIPSIKSYHAGCFLNFSEVNESIGGYYDPNGTICIIGFIINEIEAYSSEYLPDFIYKKIYQS